MAARNLSPVRTLVREAIPLIGSFAPNGAGAVDATTRKGLGFTVARSSAGLYKVTLSDKYADIVSATCALQTPAAIDLTTQIGLIVASTASVAASVELRVLVAAVATDPAANANSRLHFIIWVRNSAAKPTYGA